MQTTAAQTQNATTLKKEHDVTEVEARKLPLLASCLHLLKLAAVALQVNIHNNMRSVFQLRLVILVLVTPWCLLVPCMAVWFLRSMGWGSKCPTVYGSVRCRLTAKCRHRTSAADFKKKNWCLEFITKHSFLSIWRVSSCSHPRWPPSLSAPSE